MTDVVNSFLLSLSGDTSRLRVISFSVDEELSKPYEIHLHLASAESDIDPEGMIARQGTLELDGRSSPRHFHGVITDFAQGDTPDEDDGYDTALFLYTAVLRSAMHVLGLRSDCRIFQKKTTAEIVTAVFKDAGLPPDGLKFQTYRDAPERAYCVQYHETDLAFVHRLLAEEGWWYAFDHKGSREVMVIQDQNMGGWPIDGDDATLLYKPMAGGATTEEHATRFHLTRRAVSSSYALTDHDFTRPAFDLGAQAERDGDNALARYESHGRYFTEGRGKVLASIRLEAVRTGMVEATGQSNVAALGAGAVFTLEGAERASTNGKYLLTSMIHGGSQPQSMEEQAGDGESTYSNSFTAIPYDLPYRPQQVAKPVVHGPQSAVVVGPEGEEIYVDEHARVKVQFHWDRQGRNDANSSCWVRVAQGWAGTKYGTMFIPRIGQEVIVDFFEGDPDRPVITGRLYHATQRPPYDLPQNKTRSTIRTDTHKGEGFNEIRFEDLAGGQEIYIHAEKDMNTKVNHNSTQAIDANDVQHVGHDRKIEVKNNQDEVIGGNLTMSIGPSHIGELINGALARLAGGIGDVAAKLGLPGLLNPGEGNMALSVEKNRAETIGITDNQAVGVAKTVMVGDSYNITVGSQFSITVGKSRLTMDKDGNITISGASKTVTMSGPIKMTGETVNVN